MLITEGEDKAHRQAHAAEALPFWGHKALICPSVHGVQSSARNSRAVAVLSRKVVGPLSRGIDGTGFCLVPMSNFCPSVHLGFH
jgi:hypothetical protein